MTGDISDILEGIKALIGIFKGDNLNGLLSPVCENAIKVTLTAANDTELTREVVEYVLHNKIGEPTQLLAARLALAGKPDERMVDLHSMRVAKLGDLVLANKLLASIGRELTYEHVISAAMAYANRRALHWAFPTELVILNRAAEKFLSDPEFKQTYDMYVKSCMRA